MHVLIRYGMFLYDMRQGGMSTEGNYLHYFMQIYSFSWELKNVILKKRR